MDKIVRFTNSLIIIIRNSNNIKQKEQNEAPTWNKRFTSNILLKRSSSNTLNQLAAW